MIVSLVEQIVYDFFGSSKNQMGQVTYKEWTPQWW